MENPLYTVFMTNNAILRRVRYALDVNDQSVKSMLASADYSLSDDELKTMFMKDEDPGFEEASNKLTRHFFQGLIISKRGRQSDAPINEPTGNLSNNEVLRLIKIAFSFKDTDIIDVMALASFKVGKSEIGALLRKKNHPKYKKCGDQFLRRFLMGLTKKLRPSVEVTEE